MCVRTLVERPLTTAIDRDHTHKTNNQGYRSPRGPILVTGCDSGFGKALATTLGEKGWKVYAACLTDVGAAALAAAANVSPVRMDVTQQAEVDAAVARIAGEHPEKGLYALVNNAGGL